MIGRAIGHYRIIAKIGAGGMGEVYRAHDSKLKRDVALKVLPDSFAGDADRMARFQREAEVLASLNHPNIAAIYGVEDRALIMELVEGDSPKGPLPFDEAWHIGSQIVAALEYAHDKGIVHRDLKPANVKITPEGVVKLLDFGLAKAFTSQKEPSASVENSPTLTIGATEVGVILGTAAYMSPEQARGKAVDKRADIWAFGVVLYELLTGERLFSGEDAAETLAAVIHKQPDLAKVPRLARRLLEECLQKDPKQRLRDIGDAHCLVSEPPVGFPQVSGPSRSQLGWVTWGVAALAIVCALAVSFVHFRETPPAQAVIQFSIPSTENSSFRNWFELSPDGKYLAYGAQKDGRPTLWLRPLNSQQARPLISEAASATIDYPFWSPDSRWIAYASAGKLKKVDVTAASPAPLVICDCLGSSRGGAWGRDGVILFAPNPTSAILRVPAAGGNPVAVTTLDARLENLHRFPTFLPDGRHFLYFVGSPDRSHAGVYMGDLLAKGAVKRILDSDSHAVFVPRSLRNLAGHLLFVKDDSLRAVPFDAQRLEVTGDPAVLYTGVDQRNSRGAFSASGSGILACWAGDAFVPPELNWYGRDGKLQGPVLGDTSAPQGNLNGLSLSLDAHWLAFGLGTTLGGNNNRVWLFDLTRGGLRPLGSDKNTALMPVWSPDSKRLAFGYSEAGVVNLFVQARDQPNSPEHLLATASNAWPTDWSQDDSLLVYEIDQGGQHDLGALSLPDKKAYRWLQSPASESQGQLAPGAANPWWMS
jgi:eukaryotic-like serine/threonine-protein kinase